MCAGFLLYNGTNSVVVALGFARPRSRAYFMDAAVLYFSGPDAQELAVAVSSQDVARETSLRFHTHTSCAQGFNVSRDKKHTHNRF